MRRPVLVGHSMGGKAAMQLALKQPNRVAGLAVLDIGPGEYPVDRTVVDALSCVDLAPLAGRGDVDARLRRDLADPALRAFLLMSLERGPSGLNWRFNLRAIAANYDALAASVTEGRYDGPTLFLRGGRSAYVRGNDAEIAARFPAAAVRTVPDAGHWIHIDALQSTLDAVRQFASAVPYECDEEADERTSTGGTV